MPLEARWADEARFLKTWLENPLGTGAVSPSSRALATAMARNVDPCRSGPVIELGPGTGPVTEALIHRGVAPERLVLVEFDADFCRLLTHRFPAATVVHGDAYRLAETLAGKLAEDAAAIVSSLPLLTRPERDRLALLRDAFAISRTDAAFVQFTYGVASPIPRRRGAAVPFEAEPSAPVWLNLPPARVWVYRRAPAWSTRPEPEFRLKLKTATELLGEELREQGERLRSGLKQQADKVRRGLDGKRRPEEFRERRFGEPSRPGSRARRRH